VTNYPFNDDDDLSVCCLFAVIQMQDKLETRNDVDDQNDDQQSDDLSLSIPLPPTPASVCSPVHFVLLPRLAVVMNS